jgi:tetratricopeptide (TPR) repeat protein/GR25 family glycosyltransferase involved in LPS biosynthesis/ADP-heptose:LPS heptosyltransferase
MATSEIIAEPGANHDPPIQVVGRPAQMTPRSKRFQPPPQAVQRRRLDRAMALHQGGRLADAERLYRTILKSQPNDPDATHLLGLVRHQQGRAGEALELIERALKAIPRSAAALANRGAALQALGRHEEAIASYDRALALRPSDGQALCNRGATLFELGRYKEAVATLDRALAIRPADVAAWHKRGDALVALKRPEEAITSYDRALAIHPDGLETLMRRSEALKTAARADDALTTLDRVLELRPDSAEVLSKRGNLLLELNRPTEALECYDKALEIHPVSFEAVHNRGNALGALKRFDEAVAAYERALELRPDFVEALSNRATALLGLKRRDEALASLDRALALRPDFVEALNNRGNILHELRRHQEALAAYDQALAARPDFVAALNNRGNVLKDLKRIDEALQSLDKAIALKPDYAEALSNRGNVLKELDRFDEAVKSYERALEIQRDYPGALSNLGNALVDLGRFDEALAHYHRAVSLDPENAEHRLNRSLQLLRGASADGWREYEWRRKAKSWVERSFAGPEWVGEDISGKRVLLYAEQGLGDTIHFARFARAVAQRGGEVILEVQAPLAGLLRRLDGAPAIIRHGEGPPTYDLHLPLMSVPFVLGLGAEPVAEDTPYLSADPGRVRRWASRLPADGLRVGIAWQGNPKSPIEKGRSIPLKAFAPLGLVEGVKLISLQKGAGVEQLANLPAGMKVETLGPGFDAGPNAFLDTAAVMMNLDLVVTCDTAVAHLAGALGRPVWILLRAVPDWRWLLERETTGWYPTARLFRQSRTGDWDELLARAAAAFRQFAASPAPRGSLVGDWREDSSPDVPWLLDEAMAHHQNRRLEEAERLYLDILKVEPDHFDVTHLLGVVRHQQGRDAEAVELTGAAIKKNPRSAPALLNHGAALSALKRHEEALASYDAALRLEANWAEALRNRGNALFELKRFDEALTAFDKALEARPDYVETLNARGAALLELRRQREALAAFEKVLGLNPSHAEALVNRGTALVALAQESEAAASYEQALESYDAALALTPNWPEALRNRGNILFELKRFEEALASYDRAIQVRPNYVEALTGRGNALNALDRADEALANYERALAIQPDYVEALNNRGNTLGGLGRFEQALASYDRAIELDPENGELRFNRAYVLLLLGRFSEGWREHEFRRRKKTWIERNFAAPEWAGEDIRGKRVLLYAEQGMGDTIQFARFARSVAQLGAAVILEVQPRLKGLLERLACDAVVVRKGEELPEYDRHLPLMSAPFILGFDPQSDPAQVPYLSADPVRIDRWASRLPAGDFRVGIAWQGNAAAPIDKGRSVPLKAFAPLGQIPGVTLIGLQKGAGAEQVADLPSGMVVHTLGTNFDAERDAFLDTVAVMMSLDLIVTSDTAVAHLAGALGRPVWIVLKRAADWRWLTDRDDSPWYPSARLFRQNQAGDWDEVFARVAVELAALAAESPRSPPPQSEHWRRDDAVFVPVSFGELIDKITILRIKSERISDPGKLANVRRELRALDEARLHALCNAHTIGELEAELEQVNKSLWDIEDSIRDCERYADFGPRFIELARSVYKSNDRRAALKRRINELTGSALTEEKSYHPSQPEGGSGDLAPRLGQPDAQPGPGERQSGGFSRLLDRAIVLHQQGKFSEAERHYLTILAAQPDHLDATHLLGLIRHQQGRDLEALELIGSVLKRIPDSAPALANQGAVLHRLGRREEAVASYDRALALRPDDAKALCNRGLALHELGRLDEAQASYEQAIAAAPNGAEAYVRLGNAQHAKGRLDQAAVSWEKGVALNPNLAEIHNDLGNAFNALGRSDEAQASYRRALTVRPNYAAAWTNLGTVLGDKGEIDAAIDAHRRAIALAPTLAEAHANLVVALNRKGETREAIAVAKSALSIAPNFAPTQFALGYALKEQGDIDRAIAAYRRALELQPDFPEGHFNLAFALLLKRHDPEGWREYEWRWKGGVKGKVPRGLPGPQWQGEDLAGKAILLYAEQGRGDTLQFARFIPELAARGGKVFFEAPRTLVALLRSSGFAESIVCTGEGLPQYDFHLPLLSAPAVLGTTSETIPATIPYLAADPMRVARWRARLGEDGFRIGVAWQGEPNAKIDLGRSFPLRALAPIAALPGLRLISLQKHHGLEQIADLPHDLHVETLEPDFDEGPDAFLDTAAVMMNLDLIITSDTAVAHLAGALGRPVWIVLKRVPDWRWMLDREDSPWYPTARLFRQREAADWDGVFAIISKELASKVNHDGKTLEPSTNGPGASDACPGWIPGEHKPDVVTNDNSADGSKSIEETSFQRPQSRAVGHSNDSSRTASLRGGEPRILPAVIPGTHQVTIPGYVINLARRPDRLDRFLRWNSRKGVQLTTFDAVDGQTLSKRELLRSNIVDDEGINFSLGFLGSAMSHRELWRKCVQLERSILIFEDDVFLPDGFRNWDEDISRELGTGCDILYLGYNRDAVVCVGHSGTWSNISFRTSKKQFECEASQHNLWSKRDSHCLLDTRLVWGIGAYAVSPQGARSLLSSCFPLSGKRPIQMFGSGKLLTPFSLDGMINVAMQCGLIKARLVFPPLVIGPNEQSDSDNFDKPK